MFFSFVKTSGYHLKVFVFKLNQIHICQTTIAEKHFTSILPQNEQHEQIEIMANHGPFCKRIKNDKETSSHVEETVNVKWCVSKVPQYMFVVVFVFNVPPTAKVIWRRGHSLKSHPTDW